MNADRHGYKDGDQRGMANCHPPLKATSVRMMVSRSPSPLPSPPGRGDGSRVALSFRKAVCLILLTGSAKRGANKREDSLIAQQAGERFTLSVGERTGVRASVGLTFPGNARR